MTDKIYLVCLFGTDYSMRNRPETYGMREVVAASTNTRIAELVCARKNASMGFIEGENHEFRVVSVVRV